MCPLVTELRSRRPENWASFTDRGRDSYPLSAYISNVRLPDFHKTWYKRTCSWYISVCHKFTKFADVSSIAVRSTCHSRVLQPLTMASSFVLICVHQLADCCYCVLPKLRFLCSSWTCGIRVNKFMGQSSQRFSGTPLQSGTRTSCVLASGTCRRCSPRISRSERFQQFSCEVVVSWS